MLYEIGTASKVTQGVNPQPWREDPAVLCGPVTNRRQFWVGFVNIHC